ncbi:hypothetical protein AVL48_00015 [Amycolatopsis regifaucium]|uniref:Uncharacterized protein n=2 Tax=Amycolatopsis regifaucium TaxID=546365 RepID=A0A154MX45_9PSEU|nr:hypothetical protein AVL48_00015 [Amycolatopsis regifaucium]OKA07317.1 hypothetical protein ATP06_0215775 [Amycolatopsis regifaucium]SFI49175.1 hypothetical protein SAMN04489731_1112 [Amycolatopsis regifaucium]
MVNRVLVSAHTVAIIGQPVFAGGYLGGDYDMLGLHRVGADAVSFLAYAQILAALVLWLVRGPRWLFWVSLLLAAGETAQYFAGMDGALDLHIPLGVALVAGMVLTTVALWRPQIWRAGR